MLTGPGPQVPGPRSGPGDLAGLAAQAADDLLAHVPDTGDAATGRSVDAFVEEAAAALRVLSGALGATTPAGGPR